MMHGHDPAATVWPCPNPRCHLTWSSRKAAEDCCDDDDAA